MCEIEPTSPMETPRLYACIGSYANYGTHLSSCEIGCKEAGGKDPLLIALPGPLESSDATTLSQSVSRRLAAILYNETPVSREASRWTGRNS